MRQLRVRTLRLFFLNFIMFRLARSPSLSRSQWTEALPYSLLTGLSNLMSSANVMRPLQIIEANAKEDRSWDKPL